MMKGAGHVNAGFPAHANFLSKLTSLGNLYFYGRPLFPNIAMAFRKEERGKYL
jgi:hypothetical protein